jgi:hypothetical protein
MHEFFRYFIDGYDKLDNDLRRIKNSDMSKNLSLENESIIMDYINLCAEEFYYFETKKVIEKLIWDNWFNGMEFYFSDARFNEILKNEKSDKYNNSSYYGFLESQYYEKLINA